MELLVKLWEFVLVLLRDLVKDGWTEEDFKVLRVRRADVLALLRGNTTPVEDRGMSTENQLQRWVKLCRDLFGLELNVASLRIPERRQGFDRLIVVMPGITYARLAQVTRSKFDLYLYQEDLDEVITDCRTAEGGPYGIWVRNRKEADEENRGRSASQFRDEECETLMERWLHEMCYFSETGEHLDEKFWTICAGSRDRGGDVPGMSWNSDDRGLRVDWCGVDDRSSSGAVRSAVR
jgi:hypothetical protein